MSHASLVDLSNTFDSYCRTESHRTPSSESLKAADEFLWLLSSDICRTLDHYTDANNHSFKREHFEPKILKWYRSNPVVDRLWTKPAGYSGDYLTIEIICQNQRIWDQFDDIFLNHLLRSEMAQQHRFKVHRQAAAVEALLKKGKGQKLLNAGCGPCFDLRVALKEFHATNDIEIVLVDLDPKAISFAQEQLLQFSRNVSFTYINTDIVRAMKALCARRSEVGSYDGILFGGLFDYLPDRCIVFCLKAAAKLLGPGGEILFSQVSTSNPNRAYMKWYGDWELLERDEVALLKICEEAGFGAGEATFTREESGVAIVGSLRRD